MLGAVLQERKKNAADDAHNEAAHKSREDQKMDFKAG